MSQEPSDQAGLALSSPATPNPLQARVEDESEMSDVGVVERMEMPERGDTAGASVRTAGASVRTASGENGRGAVTGPVSVWRGTDPRVHPDRQGLIAINQEVSRGFGPGRNEAPRGASPGGKGQPRGESPGGTEDPRGYSPGNYQGQAFKAEGRERGIADAPQDNAMLQQLAQMLTQLARMPVSDHRWTARTGKKMPIPGRDGRIWDGSNATLGEHLKWFELQAAECDVPIEDYKERYLEYVLSSKQRGVRAILAGYHQWTEVREALLSFYPNRADNERVGLQDLQELARTWHERPVHRMEDLTARLEAWGPTIAGFERQWADGLGVARLFVDEQWYRGLPSEWQDRIRPELKELDPYQDEEKFPAMQRVLQIMKRKLSVRNVVENALVERDHPEIKTSHQLATEAEQARSRYLASLQEGRKEVIHVRDVEIKAENPVTVDTSRTKEVKPPKGNDVDWLAGELARLQINSAKASEGEKKQLDHTYRAYLAKLKTIQPNSGSVWPNSLYGGTTFQVSQVAVSEPEIEDLFKEYLSLRENNRARYRQLPEYRKLYTVIQSRSGTYSSVIPTPLPEDYVPMSERPQSRGQERNNQQGGNRPRRPSFGSRPGGSNSNLCHWCRGSGHIVRNCPKAWEREALGIIKMVDGRWYFNMPDKSLEESRIPRDADQTYDTTVKNLLDQAEKNNQTVETAKVMAADYVPFEQSMYGEDLHYSNSVRVDGEVSLVVGPDGQEWAGPVWCPKETCKEGEVTVMMGVASEDEWSRYDQYDEVEYDENLPVEEEKDTGRAWTNSVVAMMAKQLHQQEVVSAPVQRTTPGSSGFRPYPPSGSKEAGRGTNPAPSATGRVTRSAPQGQSAPVTPLVKAKPTANVKAKEPPILPASVPKASVAKGSQAKEPRPRTIPQVVLSRKPNILSEDVEMKPSSAPKPPSGGSRWSEFSKQIDATQVLRRIALSDASVTLKLSELCVISPSFQRTMNELTRVHQPEKKVSFAADTSAVHVVDDEGEEYDLDVESGNEPEEVEAGAALAWVGEAFQAGHEDLVYECEANEAQIDEEFDEGDGVATVTKPRGSLEPALIARSWGKVSQPNEEYLAVGTCSMLAEMEGEPVVAMLDDGSEVNIMPQELWEKLNARKPLSLRTDTIFRVSGIHGASQALLGHTEVQVTLGGLTSRHTFWVAQGVSRLILGMPFFWKNRVDIYWSGDRRVVRQNTEQGQTLQYMHLPGGPKKTLYDAWQRRKVVVRQAEAVCCPIEVEEIIVMDEDHQDTQSEASGDGRACRCFDKPEEVPVPGLPSSSKNEREEEPATNEVTSCAASVSYDNGSPTLSPEEDSEMDWAAATMLRETRLAGGNLEFDVRMNGESHISGESHGRAKELASVMSYGAYKSVAKKKRPVETIYPEVEKHQMVTPPGILDDLPTVQKRPKPWRELPEGKRLTKERLEAALQDDEEHPGF